MANALEGIKVIETASAEAGPGAGRLLADWGADVIHVEPPGRGDISRGIGRLIGGMGGGDRTIHSNIDFATERINCNKRSIALDLSKREGQEVLHKLLKEADVLISNFRPCDIKKFGLEYETLTRVNRRLVWANLTGWGFKGPDSDLPGFDFASFWGRSGILHVLLTPDAEPPTTPIGLGDRVAAINHALGIMAALFIRERTGIGQQVQTSLLHTAVYVNSHDVGGCLVTGCDRQNSERHELANALLNSYKTKDGRWLRLAINHPDVYWSRFCRAVGREDLEHDPRFESFVARLENYADLFQIIEREFGKKTLKEWQVHLNESGLPWSPIASLPEVVDDEQAKTNDFFVGYDHPTHGPLRLVANPIQLSGVQVAIRRPAPELGQHTEEVLLEHGYEWDDIARLKEQGVIG